MAQRDSATEPQVRLENAGARWFTLEPAAFRPGAPTAARVDEAGLGLYPIVTFQYNSTTLYQVSYHIQYLFL